MENYISIMKFIWDIRRLDGKISIDNEALSFLDLIEIDEEFIPQLIELSTILNRNDIHPSQKWDPNKIASFLKKDIKSRIKFESCINQIKTQLEREYVQAQIDLNIEDVEKLELYFAQSRPPRLRGHELYHDNENDLRYLDTLELVKNNNERPCMRCGKIPTSEGHDACLGGLPGVNAACCGHGVEEGYISFENGVSIYGDFKFIEKGE